MADEVDISATLEGTAGDHRLDRDKNAILLDIVFAGGTFGNFLRYILDKFSKKTPDITGQPFTKIGTCHELPSSKFSGMIKRHHFEFIERNKNKSGLPVCIITPSTRKHFLYLKKSQWFRAGDYKVKPDDLWKKAIGEMPEFIKGHAMKIKKLYKLKETAHFIWIPKFIVRDWYKLEFLQDLESTYNHQWFESKKKHNFFNQQKLFELDLETFFSWNAFITNLKRLDTFFGLDLDFGRQNEMQVLFEKGLELDKIRQECNLADSCLDMDDQPLDGLDVSTEAFIYAKIERDNDFIQTPLTNRFFRDVAEIRQFVEYYPQHYKAMNPNMPSFNGITNPYYLKK
jgi:hypothetical protein